MNIYKGTISAISQDERTVLEGLGIIVGDWNNDIGGFIECILDDDSLAKIDPYFGRFIWDIKLVKVIRSRGR